MGTSKRQIGPVTEHVAQELRAQRARLQLSYDALAERSGVSKPTVVGCLKAERTIALEVYILLCRALGLDPARLIGQAVARDTAQPAHKPLSMQELKQQRMLEQAQPMEWAADDREDDDAGEGDW